MELMSNFLMHVDRQQKAAAAEAAAEAAQKESADAFRGLHLDPKAHHWDEVRPILMSSLTNRLFVRRVPTQQYVLTISR